MFEWPVLSEEELESSRGFKSDFVAPGEYRFKVFEVSDGISQTGNPRLMLYLFLFDEQGKRFKFVTFLSGHEKMAWLVKHFFESIGHPEWYGKGKIDISRFKDTEGKLVIALKENKKNCQMEPAVDNYIVDENIIAQADKTPEFKEDKIPF